MLDSYTKANIAQSALITIDTQNDFTLDKAPACIAGTKEVVPNMVKLLDGYRDNNLLIIHVIRLYLPDGSNVDMCRRQVIKDGKKIVAPGSEGAELVRELKPDHQVKLNADKLLAGEFQSIGDKEYVMYKPRWGAFYGTVLQEFLHNHGIDTLVFCGCNFPNCPRTSIYEASERDFRIALVCDAVSQLDQKDKRELNNIGVNLITTNNLQVLLCKN